MSYPPPPPGSVPPPGGKPRLRGHTGIRVGAILSVVGLAVMVVGIVVIVTASLNKVKDFQRVSFADRTGTVTFSSSGKYLAYYEAPDVSSSITTIPAFEIRLAKSGSNDPVNLVRYGNNANGKIDKLTYDEGDHHGVAVLQYQIDTPGSYDVSLVAGLQVNSAADVAFGKSIAAGTFIGAGLTGGGALLLLAGIIVLIVALVRRRRHKNQLLAAAGYGSYPPPAYGGYPGQPPAGAYPPPGYGQGSGQGYPQGYGQQPNQPYGHQYGRPAGDQPGERSPWQPPTSLRKDEPPEQNNPWPPQQP